MLLPNGRQPCARHSRRRGGAIDGKALRGSVTEGRSPIHMVSAWATENRLVLGQVTMEDKSNEITAIPELLKKLQLAGCIVTIDAMGCLKDIAQAISAAGADYSLALKANHQTLRGEVERFMDGPLAHVSANDCTQTANKLRTPKIARLPGIVVALPVRFARRHSHPTRMNTETDNSLTKSIVQRFW